MFTMKIYFLSTSWAQLQSIGLGGTYVQESDHISKSDIFMNIFNQSLYVFMYALGNCSIARYIYIMYCQ